MAARASCNVTSHDYVDITNISEVELGDDSDADIDIGGEDDLSSDDTDWEYE